MFNWNELRFGKHQGKTLPHIVFIDPCWFMWAYMDERIFNKSWKPICEQADYVYERSRKIKIPNNPNGTKVVYYYYHMYGFVNDFALSDASDDLSDLKLDNHTIDLSLPHLTGPVDVRVIRPFIRSLKRYLFGSEKVRLTRRRCERFFEDDDNFVLDNTRNKHFDKKVKRKSKRKRRRIRVKA